MTLIRRPSPFGELLSLRQAMDRLFEDSFVRPRGGGGGQGDEHQLALDIYTTSDALVVEAALPGVKPEDLDINVLGDTLTISATTHEEQSRNEEGYSYREIRRGSFSRQVTLPTGLKTDAATADFENGLLRLSFPKAEEAKPRQIQIKPAMAGGASQPVQVDQGSTGADATSADSQAASHAGSEADDSQPATEWQSNQPNTDWSSNQPTTDWQTSQYGQPQSEGSNDQWRTGSEWQSNGQGQTNEQARVEQGS